MPADLYRDARLGLRARLGELVARIREREAEVTDAFWASLEPDVEARVAAMYDARDLVQAGKELSLDEMARAEARLAAGLDELDRLIARLPALEEEWRKLPDEVDDPPPPAEAWPIAIPSHDERSDLERSFRTVVRDRDRAAEIERDGRRSWLARFRDRDAPFALRATAYTHGNGQISEVAMWLVTGVPRAAPRLVVRHESVMSSFAKVLGLKHEVEVGEPSFDGLFLIDGAKEAALRLLVPPVRTLLLALARFDVPTLEIDPPRLQASLRWRFEPVAAALDAAVRVLCAVRGIDARVCFRR